MSTSILHSLNAIQQASQRRTRAQQRPRHVRQFVSSATRALARLRRLSLPLLSLCLCYLLVRLVLSLRPAHRSVSLRPIIPFAPSSLDLPTARIYYRNRSVQPFQCKADGADFEPLWQNDVERIDVPLGTRLSAITSGVRQSISILAGDDCSSINCAALRSAVLGLDLALALRQLSDSPTGEEMVIRLPSLRDWRKSEVTYVTQFSMSRFDRVLALLQAYNGPLSLAIYLTDPQDVSNLRARLSEPTTAALLSRHSLTLLKPSYTDVDFVKRLRYPINRLRNLALALSPTRYVLVTDADFVPSPDFARIVSTRAAALLGMPNPTLVRRAVVISAFQAHTSALPASLTDLESAFKNGTVTLTDRNAGHGPSLPSMLFGHPTHPATPSDPIPASWSYEAAYEPQWEPYYIFHRPSHPLYDERFTDQGGDKQSHALLLNALGYSFHVLRDAWLIHPDRSSFDASESEWPSARLASLLRSEDDDEATGANVVMEEGHFSIAQSDKDRFRYFEHFLPEMEGRFGKNVRWPRGASLDVARRTVGRKKGHAVFGL